MQLIVRATLVFSLLALLSSCGFKPRGQQLLPSNIDQVWTYSPQAHSPMLRSLNQRLKLYNIATVENVEATEESQTIAIYLNSDNLDRRLLSLFATGQVAEYELIYTVRYRVKLPDKDAFDAVVKVTQEYQDDPDQVLAKSRELDLILTEMRVTAADRIIRLLASQAAS